MKRNIWVVTEEMPGYIPNQGGYFRTKAQALDWMLSLKHEHLDLGARVAGSQRAGWYYAEYETGSDYSINLDCVSPESLGYEPGMDWETFMSKIEDCPW